MGNTLGNPRCFFVRRKLRRVYKEIFRILLDTQIATPLAPAEIPPRVLALVSVLTLLEAELLVAKNDHFILTETLALGSRQVIEAREWLRQLEINRFRVYVAERIPV